VDRKFFLLQGLDALLVDHVGRFLSSPGTNKGGLACRLNVLGVDTLSLSRPIHS
jgi:hypothetical protein